LAHYQRAMELGYGDVAGLYEAIGDLQTLRGDYASALKSYENASSLASIDGLAVLEHKLGIVYERRGDGELAGRHFEAALAAFGENEAGGRARVLADWSLTAHYANEPERAQLLAEQSLGLAEAVGDARALAQVNNILGILATHQEDFSAARGYLEQSLALAVELSDVGAQVAALNNLALGYKADDKWNDAVELTSRALRLCESQGDKHREAALHNNLADLLHSAGRGDEAMAHLKRAVALFAEIGVTGDELVWQPEIWKLTEW
jgi:tetratricopeptide (TPR) repeat protein